MKLIIIIMALLFCSCSASNKIHKKETFLMTEQGDNMLKFSVEIENLSFSPPHCGTTLQAGLYKARVLNATQKLIYGEYILIYIRCKEAFHYLINKKELILSNDLSLLKNYNVSDFSGIDKENKILMTKFVLLK